MLLTNTTSRANLRFVSMDGTCHATVELVPDSRPRGRIVFSARLGTQNSIITCEDLALASGVFNEIDVVSAEQTDVAGSLFSTTISRSADGSAGMGRLESGPVMFREV